MATNDTAAVVRKQAEEARAMERELHKFRLDAEEQRHIAQLLSIGRCEAEALASVKQSPLPPPPHSPPPAPSRRYTSKPMSFGESLATSPYLMRALKFAGGFVIGWLIGGSLNGWLISL